MAVLASDFCDRLLFIFGLLSLEALAFLLDQCHLDLGSKIEAIIGCEIILKYSVEKY